MRLLENFGKRVVDAGEQFAWITGDLRLFFNQCANHTGDQRRAHAVPHNIADENASGLFTDGKHAKKIAAYVTCRKVQTQETERAFVI